MLRELGDYLRTTREALQERYGHRQYTQKAVANRIAERVPHFTERMMQIAENPTYMPDPRVLRALAEEYKVPYKRLLTLAGYLSSEDLEVTQPEQIIQSMPLDELIALKYNIESIKFVEGIVQLVESQVEIQQQRGSGTHQAVRDEE